MAASRRASAPFKFLLAASLAVSFCPIAPAEAEPSGAESLGAQDDTTIRSADSIVDWTQCGTCEWMIDANRQLIIQPSNGLSGELEDWAYGVPPWSRYQDMIQSVRFNGTVSVSRAIDMFCGCSLLTSLDLSGLDTSKATSMSLMFHGCSSLKSIDLSGIKTPAVEDMSSMFSGCSSLESIDLSGFNTSHVVNMSAMFENCTSLQSLDVSSFDTSNVKFMASMFANCKSLQNLDISSFDTSVANSMRGTFDGCSALRSVTLGEGFSFEGASGVRQCSLPAPSGEGLTGK